MIHQHSLDALEEIREDGSKQTREQRILQVFAEHGNMTDRAVLARINPGSDNLNYCRPRITELIRKGKIEEKGSTQDSVTGKTVRVCGLVSDQMEMF
jgi:predicted HTH transcriptional regulator